MIIPNSLAQQPILEYQVILLKSCLFQLTTSFPPLLEWTNLTAMGCHIYRLHVPLYLDYNHLGRGMSNTWIPTWVNKWSHQSCVSLLTSYLGDYSLIWLNSLLSWKMLERLNAEIELHPLCITNPHSHHCWNDQSWSSERMGFHIDIHYCSHWIKTIWEEQWPATSWIICFSFINKLTLGIISVVHWSLDLISAPLLYCSHWIKTIWEEQ